MIRLSILILLCAIAPAYAQTANLAGVINDYVPVSAIDECGFNIEVESTEAFAPLDRVLVIQLTGASVDSSATPAFGSILDWRAAGRYEFSTIRCIDGDTITLYERLLRAYDPSHTQLIRVPRHSFARITGTVIPKPWDGRTGGVVALEVLETLTMDAGIDASAAGFRGGPVVVRRSDAVCNTLDLFLPDSVGSGGGKGFGVAALFDLKYHTARGAIANGGGGGNDHNSGGGGGGNGGIGGMGGLQWSGCESISNGGIGGRAIGRDADKLLLIAGGGAGSGHANNNIGTPGGHGGGIVIVRATRIDGNGSLIVSDGQIPAETAGNDGAGGGGAGGTIVLDVDDVLSPLGLRAKGGDGANVSGDRGCHGPGGGGGGGVIMFSTDQVPRNVTLAVAAGDPGRVISTISPCFGSAYGALTGEPGIVRVAVPIVEGHSYPTIAVAHIASEPGQIVNVPVRLIPVVDYAFRPLVAVRFELASDRRLLLPLKRDAVGITASSDTLTTAVEAAISSESDTIATFSALTLLGYSPNATIEIVDAAFGPVHVMSCPAYGAVINGAVDIAICEEGSARLVNTSTATTLKTIAPNPSSAQATIAYTLAEDGATRVLLRDARGDIVSVVFDGVAASGIHAAFVDTRGLASGVYSIELVTATERIVRRMHVVR